jgi:hypothetical protein
MTGQILKTGFLGAVRDGAWLSQRRVHGYLRLFAAANMVGLILAICRAHGWLLPAEPHLSTEFVSFYTAGRLIDAGQATEIYVPATNLAAYIHSNAIPEAFAGFQRAMSGDPQIQLLSFFYPPVFWLVCAPLAHFGFYPAFAIWVAGTLSGFIACLQRLFGHWRDLWMAAAFLPVVKNGAIGENAYLSATLIGFGLMALPSRPFLAGILFGGLCYKPHFLLPIVILLIAGRYWRAIAGMAASVLILSALCGIMFGLQRWIDYFSIVVPHAEWMFQHGGFSYGLQVTPFSAIRQLGGSIPAGNIVQAATGLFAATVIVITARRGSPDVQAAAVTASFPLMASVMLDYDLCITGLAVLFLRRATLQTGWRSFEKTLMAALFVMPYVVFSLRAQLHTPIDPLIPAAFMAALLARVLQQQPVPA